MEGQFFFTFTSTYRCDPPGTSSSPRPCVDRDLEEVAGSCTDEDGTNTDKEQVALFPISQLNCGEVYIILITQEQWNKAALAKHCSSTGNTSRIYLVHAEDRLLKTEEILLCAGVKATRCTR